MHGFCFILQNQSPNGVHQRDHQCLCAFGRLEIEQTSKTDERFLLRSSVFQGPRSPALRSAEKMTPYPSR
jgi:hypothetical protein